MPNIRKGGDGETLIKQEVVVIAGSLPPLTAGDHLVGLELC